MTWRNACWLSLTIALAAAPATAQAPEPLTIYSSLPLQGDARAQSQDVVRGMQMALDERGGKAAGRTIRYVSLDDTGGGAWHPAKVSANARKAASDPSTVAYLGEFNSGGSAVSIPILNEAGILQISPSNTYVGLTRAEARDPGEPDKYYPSGVRTYARVVPADHLQASALVAALKADGVRAIYVVNDAEVYGRGVAEMIVRRARAAGISIRGQARYPRFGRPRFAAIATRVRRSRARAMVFGGITQNHAVSLWRAVHRAAPKLRLYGIDGVAESAFTERIPRSARDQTFITNPTLAPEAYPGGAAFTERFKARHGTIPEPYAIYGYEAMALALDAIERGGGTRAATVTALFATRDRDSVLGRYSIDPNGDTTLPLYGGYAVSGSGRLEFDRVLDSSK
jgi:branched-chain amino acid transport system substrate-binding protein